MGSEEDPKDGGAVAGAVFGAVFIYIVRLPCATAYMRDSDTIQGFFVFCGFQAFLHFRESRRGAISLS
jgi:ribonuclease kappa